MTALTFCFTTSDYAIAGRALVGLIFIVVILFMPQGLLGRFATRRSRSPQEAQPDCPDSDHRSDK